MCEQEAGGAAPMMATWVLYFGGTGHGCSLGLAERNFGGDVEGGIGGGQATVDGGLQKDFLDLLGGDAVVGGGTQVHAQFIGAVQGDHHRDGEEAAGVARPGRSQISPQA